MGRVSADKPVGTGRFAKIGFALIIVGAGLAWLGLRFDGPFIGASLTVFGSAALLGGLHSIATRSHRTAGGHLRSALTHEHRNFAALLLGVTMIIPGLVMVVAGLVAVLGMTDDLGAWVMARPGPIAMAAGAWAAVGGIGLLISRWTYEHQPTSWWQRLPGRLVALLVIVIGGALMAVGRTLTLSPQSPQGVLKQIVEWIAKVLSA